MENRNMSRLFTREIAIQALKDSFVKLNPRTLVKNPVIFIVGIGALMTTVVVFVDIYNRQFSSFNFQITLWLWFTVLFANFAEAIAEGRGKAQADSLRKSRTQTKARLLVRGKEEIVFANDLKKGDVVICDAGDIIPADGDVIEGIASVDESAITGESAPVIRESGGDRSAVTGGTKVISDRITIRITSEPGFTFLDRMIALVEGAKRQKTP
ncbi:MAG TPA: HAD-IC family P-type ATPase, partial [Bacteroidales bacterium]